jgi:hypothetical protein
MVAPKKKWLALLSIALSSLLISPTHGTVKMNFRLAFLCSYPLWLTHILGFLFISPLFRMAYNHAVGACTQLAT